MDAQEEVQTFDTFDDCSQWSATSATSLCLVLNVCATLYYIYATSKFIRRARALWLSQQESSKVELTYPLRTEALGAIILIAAIFNLARIGYTISIMMVKYVLFEDSLGQGTTAFLNYWAPAILNLLDWATISLCILGWVRVSEWYLNSSFQVALLLNLSILLTLLLQFIATMTTLYTLRPGERRHHQKNGHQGDMELFHRAYSILQLLPAILYPIGAAAVMISVKMRIRSLASVDEEMEPLVTNYISRLNPIATGTYKALSALTCLIVSFGIARFELAYFLPIELSSPQTSLFHVSIQILFLLSTLVPIFAVEHLAEGCMNTEELLDETDEVACSK